MKKILLILLLGLVLISFASATIQTLGTFQQGDCIGLIQTCGNCTYNNISTIITEAENPTVYLINNTMSKQDTYYNYTFCNTTSIGKYIVNGFGDLDGEKTIWNYDFEITPSGFESTSAQSILYVIVLLISCLVLALCAYGAVKIPFQNARNDENKVISISHFKYLKVMFAFFSYLILLWILNLMILITNNFLTSTVAFAFFKMIYTILLFCFYPILMLTLAIFVVNILHDKKIRKMLKRGIFPD